MNVPSSHGKQSSFKSFLYVPASHGLHNEGKPSEPNPQDGTDVGIEVGCEVGWFVGWFDGNEVGCPVGDVGSEVGWFVGNDVGLTKIQINNK